MANPKPRPTWDATWLGVAALLARRATCPRLHAGAALVSPDNRLLSTGYNGVPASIAHCDAPGVGCLLEAGHCIRAAHAEQNAVANAARVGVPVLGATLYVTAWPCMRCATLTVNAGVARVVLRPAYGQRDTAEAVLALYRQAGVEVTVWEPRKGEEG